MNTKLENIEIKGARVHNLKNISVQLPRNKFIVITGLSGSGKSSLAFDTLYAEGQRRYVESLSSYARQFLGRMSKPEVDYIKGISPAIAIEQKVNTRNPRSTVGTSTEVYEYLKLLFARIGITYSPISGQIVKRHSVKDVIDFYISLPPNSKVVIGTPLLVHGERELKQQLELLMQQGFSRVMKGSEVLRIDELMNETNKDECDQEGCLLVVDRLLSGVNDSETLSRLADSVETAFYEGKGNCILMVENNKEFVSYPFSNRFELDGIEFDEPTANFFSFNNPQGACRSCEGYGTVIGIDEDLVIPDKNLSVFDGAIACWKGEKMSEWNQRLIITASKFNFPIHRPFYQLSKAEKSLLWTGNQYFQGLNAFFQEIEENSYKIQYRVMLSRFRGKTLCPDCHGSRLRKEISYIKIGGKSISDLVLMSVDDALEFFNSLELSEYDMQIAQRLLTEIRNRLNVLMDVGLGYLSLNRKSATLSGGESQRINLATSLGTSLVGSMYILDEPSVGLHPRDTERLISVLKNLQKIGNTVIVVEHDEDIMRNADYIVDMGPEAGSLGGEVVFSGNFDQLITSSQSLTAKYLRSELKINTPTYRRTWKDYIEVSGATENNLKNVSVKFPLNVFCCVTGVSGSGKTSLVKSILFPALRKLRGEVAERTGRHSGVFGDWNRIGAVEMVDQNPIGRSSRSNPATYMKVYDDIRTLFSNQKLAKVRSYKAGSFSFNVEGGRCEECQGDGVVRIEMQFMADIFLKCEHCQGKRFKNEILDVKFDGKDISEILQLTVDESVEFFKRDPKETLAIKISEKLQVLQDVGLGYVQLGQSSSTLSGGEAQRIKLAFFLSKGGAENRTLFIFDEPTTGLHFHDIHKLRKAMDALIDKGHSVIVIEHNLDLIKCADWIIELGPDGGEAGGELVFEGLPEDLILNERSFTARFLKAKL